LPAVVESDPGKSQLLGGREGVVNLFQLDVAAVSPGAPDGAEGAVGRGRHLKSLMDHETAEFAEGAEVVSLMDRDEGVKSVKAFARLQGLFFLRLHGYRGVSCVGHGNRERDQAGNGFDVAYREADVFAPDIDDGSASAVVAGVHAQVVFLAEAGMEGNDPVGALLVGTALIGPECRGGFGCGRAQGVAIVGPSLDGERRGAMVGVLDFENCHRGEIVIDGDGDFLAYAAVLADDGQALPGAESVGDLVGLGGGQGEVGVGAVGGY
jgi:hypothetical protein